MAYIPGIVTNEIQYRGYNTVRLAPGSGFNCHEYFVEGMEYISHSIAVYSVNGLSSATRAKTRFIGSNGLTLSTVDHSFAVPSGVFEDAKIEAVPVPTGARLAKLEVFNPTAASSDYWFGLAKSEEGERCTPYTMNFAGQMTYITPTGIYTGTITGEQIILTGGDSLDERFTTINSQMLSMTSSINSADASITQIQAGQASFVKYTDIDRPSSTVIDGGNIKTGTIVAGALTVGSVTSPKIATGAVGSTKLADSAVTEVKIANGAVTAGKIYAGSVTSDKIAAGAVTAAKIEAGAITSAKIAANTITAAKVANMGGFTFSDYTMVGTSGNTYVRISGASGYHPIVIGTSSDNITFHVSTAGVLTATGVNITGTVGGKVTANSNSSLAGSLNYTSGYHSGSLNNTSGTHKGALYRTTGSHWGSHTGAAYNSSGTIGGTTYSSGSNGVLFQNPVFVGAQFNCQWGKVTGSQAQHYDWSVTGNIYCSGTVTQASDKALKENIKPISSQILKELYSVNVREFDFIDKKKGDLKSVGVIAQDVISKAPLLTKYIITPGDDGYLSADYIALSTLSLLAIQDLNKRVRALERKIA
jgi:hypothetical protein